MQQGIIESMINWLAGYGITKEIIIFCVSILPILELRGGMIAASIMGVPLTTALPVCILANLIPIPFIIFFIRAILGFLQEHGPIKKFANWVVAKGNKHSAIMEQKYSKTMFLGLFLFVAIPLPGTGAWTGSLVAALLRVSPKKAIPALMLGVVGCSVIMTILTYLIPGFLMG